MGVLSSRRASPHTVAAYHNSFRLLLRFAAARLHRDPSRLVIADLDAAFLGEFLDHLERQRGNCARSRNARLAALRAFFRYVALSEPAYALHCQRVLAIPSKRCERGIVEFLNDEEIQALLGAPNLATWIGRRDRAILLVAVQTGLRVSESSARSSCTLSRLKWLKRTTCCARSGSVLGNVGPGCVISSPWAERGTTSPAVATTALAATVLAATVPVKKPRRVNLSVMTLSSRVFDTGRGGQHAFCQTRRALTTMTRSLPYDSGDKPNLNRC